MENLEQAKKYPTDVQYTVEGCFPPLYNGGEMRVDDDEISYHNWWWKEISFLLAHNSFVELSRNQPDARPAQIVPTAAAETR